MADMKVLVCGGRDFNDIDLLYSTLDEFHRDFTIDVIIKGCAKGADQLAGRWAESRDITQDQYPAKWGVYGRSAGYKRNTQMLVEGKPDIVIAFPGGRGTAMMMDIARRADVHVIDIEEKEDV